MQEVSVNLEKSQRECVLLKQQIEKLEKKLALYRKTFKVSFVNKELMIIVFYTLYYPSITICMLTVNCMSV